MQNVRRLKWCLVLSVMTAAMWVPGWDRSGGLVAQTEQVVEVAIKDYRFLTRHGTLRLGLPTTIRIRNEDAERHDFGSTMFEGLPTQIEQDGVIVYGRGLGGVYLDPNRAAVVRFDMTRPGRYEFRCSIHPNMEGELLLLSTEAV